MSVKIRQGIYAVMFLIMTYNAVRAVMNGADPIITAVGFVGGLLLGIFVISRVTLFGWNENKGGKIASSMDMISIIILISYVIFMLTRSRLLGAAFDGPEAAALSSSIVSG